MGSVFEIHKPHENQISSSHPFESEVRSARAKQCDELQIQVTSRNAGTQRGYDKR